MSVDETDRITWAAPSACTLPTADQPLRVREFDDLFATSLRGALRIDGRNLRLDLVAEPGVAAEAADLATRETRCCSFFSFSVVISDRQLSLNVSVPDDHVEVLDGLAARAAECLI